MNKTPFKRFFKKGPVIQIVDEFWWERIELLMLLEIISHMQLNLLNRLKFWGNKRIA